MMLIRNCRAYDEATGYQHMLRIHSKLPPRLKAMVEEPSKDMTLDTYLELTVKKERMLKELLVAENFKPSSSAYIAEEAANSPRESADEMGNEGF
jgi:hypothetical protein